VAPKVLAAALEISSRIGYANGRRGRDA
jgi:hypothetical protein